jgi:hypothetical protein
MPEPRIDVERVTMKAWQCIGCGRIEAPQPCIGICQDRKVELVYASELAASNALCGQARARAEALLALVRRIALTTPRDGAWERSYRALQDDARRLLAATERDVAAR